jgi:alkanesulfonate monooxygenase SsuD/methylene tetrahydromethanopterin reductase-like flavin-dependent oxidoreductase (luciferase family)
VRNNLSIRQLYQQAFIGNAHNVVVGTPEMVADTMEEWFTQGGADGFNVLPAYSPFSFFEFAERVVPILQQRGLTRTEYAGPTMRENMQLPPPKPVRIPQAA